MKYIMTIFVLSLSLMAEDVTISGNFGVMSNYISRGMTQRNDKVSVKAGVSTFYNGIYSGATILPVDFGTDDDFEIDYYVGYTNQLGIFTLQRWLLVSHGHVK